MSDTFIREQTEHKLQGTQDGDHERFAHYVVGKNPKATITESMVTGVPITALCGKKWVPSRDASKFPVCPECQSIKDMLLRK